MVERSLADFNGNSGFGTYSGFEWEFRALVAKE